MAASEDRVSRAAYACSVIPDSSYACETFERKTAVRRSIASATTAGEGGSGTFDANPKFESADERAGVLVKADRARVVAGSISDSSLSLVSKVEDAILGA
jgi:hypothetical protein